MGYQPISPVKMVERAYSEKMGNIICLHGSAMFISIMTAIIYLGVIKISYTPMWISIGVIMGVCSIACLVCLAIAAKEFKHVVFKVELAINQKRYNYACDIANAYCKQ